MSPWIPPSSHQHGGRRDAPSLPSGLTPIRDILEERVAPGRMISVIGLVKDCRLPIPTGGTDFKMTLTIYDVSTQDESEGLVFNIFRPEAEMPQVDATDVILVHAAKVQRYRGGFFSLLSNRTTDIHIYSCSKIPRPPRSAEAALLAPIRKCSRAPNAKEHTYVSWLFHKIDKDTIPDKASFQVLAAQSVNIKNKFSLLKDISDGRFNDMIVQVVKEPYDLGDKMTIWVTDYTENASFFQHTWGGADVSGWDGDPYGYTSKYSNGAKAWPGPFGRRSMQITAYEPHASYIRTEVKAGDWVRLLNVQTKYGSNSANLEGFLREDRQAGYSKLQVDLLDPVEDPENADPRLKDAIRRKREYEKDKRHQIKEIKAESGAKKRKGEEDDTSEKTTSKKRRKAKREAKFKEIKEKEAKAEEMLGLNELVKCENQDQGTSLLSSLLEPSYYNTKIDGQEVKLQLPFVNAKYRAHVHVVDFHPSRIEDFAVSRKATEYDMLSDYSGDSFSSDDETRRTLDRFGGERIWEWRFALELEDVSPRAKPPASLWVVVDNASAQLLTSLDAGNLRGDADRLATLRERLFKLWGDLEEKKAKENQKRRPGDRPPLEDSDDDGDGGATKQPGSSQVRNKPFTCCIKQYGVRTRTGSAGEANAGEGKQWERVFGLFGTKICS